MIKNIVDQTLHLVLFPLSATLLIQSLCTRFKRILRMSAEEVGKAFCQHYYDTFNVNAEQLAGLFVSPHPTDAVLLNTVTTLPSAFFCYFTDNQWNRRIVRCYPIPLFAYSRDSHYAHSQHGDAKTRTKDP